MRVVKQGPWDSPAVKYRSMLSYYPNLGAETRAMGRSLGCAIAMSPVHTEDYGSG
jgi:hypothetical protein